MRASRRFPVIDAARAGSLMSLPVFGFCRTATTSCASSSRSARAATSDYSTFAALAAAAALAAVSRWLSRCAASRAWVIAAICFWA